MYQVPVIDAIRITGATCKASGLYQRLQRHRSREAAAEEIATAEYDRINDDKAAAALVSLGGEAAGGEAGGGEDNDATSSVVVEGGHARCCT